MSPWLMQARRFAARLRRAAHYDHHAFWRRQPIRTGTVMYESFAGNGMLDNPEAIFRHLLDAPEFSQFEHIWVLSDFQRYAATIAEFRDRANVRFVRHRSPQYFRALATSEFLINNATFPVQFSKRPGQVYLNTWHGTPLKKMGYDMPDGARQGANTMRNFMQADYLLAQNPFMAEQMYEKAYRLDNLFEGFIIEEGYPRVDRQYLTEDELIAARWALEHAGLAVSGREIVLYAPTWKGDSFSDPRNDIDQLLRVVTQLQSELGDKYAVLLKTHQVVHAFAAENPLLRSVLVSNELPTNILLGIASALVTDYSSIMFDMLATGKPIAYYTPDIGEYGGGRGLYLEPSQWPGPVHTSVSDLAASLLGMLTHDTPVPSDRYTEWQQRFTPFDDGGATERVVDVVFRGRRRGYRVRRATSDARTRVLLYLGGMNSNGITSSGLSLLRAIDGSRYDVSVIIAASDGQPQRANQAQIPEGVRQFLRSGGMNGSKLDHLRRKLSELRGRSDLHGTPGRQREMWDAEWVRCVGGSRFDVVIDFSGYSPFWALLLLHSPLAVRAIWLHNEMLPEVGRTRHMSRTLPALFALYGEFDQLVSVSPRLRDRNAAELSRYAPADRFTVVRNLIDVERVRARAEAPLALGSALGEHTGSPDWISRLQRDDGIHWFVSVGRLSPEKNQARLIEAFAALRKTRNDVGLLIVGDGPLFDSLQRQLHAAGLADSAFLTGLQDNPFAIMARSDCFVLSSDYEGQPMVLLEAAALHLPIVCTAFASVNDAVPGGAVRVVERSSEALAEGMRAFLRGEVQQARLESGYVEEVRAEFDRVATVPRLASGAAA